MTEQWIPNFRPESSSVELIAELCELPNLSWIGLTDSKYWIERYRQNNGLDSVNLRDVRDQAAMEANYFQDQDRTARIRVVGLAADLMDYQSNPENYPY